MKTILLRASVVVLMITFFATKLNAQPGVLNPNDPDVIFTGGVATPPYNQISKWGHSTRLSWNGQTPFQYGYKSYYYKAMAFRLKFPKTYVHNVSDGKKYPLFIFLHGLGERGAVTDNEYQMRHGGLTHAEHVNDGTFDGFVMYPQSSNGYHNNYFPMISELIDSFAKYVKVDIDRVILSGLSSGGQSDWDFMGTSTYARKFAALLPISAAQLEDKPTFTNFITVPVWLTNGGLDLNPAPETVNDIIAYWKSLGGSIKQTYYPYIGHGVWNNFWAEPDYFPYLSVPHKANPLVYFGRSEFCPGDPVNITLGLQAGFNAYEWQKDGLTIPGATSNNLNVTSFGTYRARFKRTSTSAWSDWSPSPVVVKIKETTITPPIEINGLYSNVVPAPDGKTTVPLTVPGQFASYEWRRVSDNALVSSSAVYNASAGQYTVKVMEEFGCSSTVSPVYTVIGANGAGKPDKPTDLIAVTYSTNEIKLDWNDNPNPLNPETGFEIYRSATAGGPYTLIKINGADNRSFKDSGLASNKTYYYVVRAVNNSGASDITNEVSAQTQPLTQNMPAPANLKITTSNRFSVSLAWDPVYFGYGDKKYDIYIDGVKSYTTGNTSFVVTNLTQNQVYTFKVKVRDDVGNISPFSNQVTAVAAMNGLNYKYYEGSFTTLPNFPTLIPAETGNTPNIDLSVRNQNDNFTILWEGYIYIPQAGTYNFRTTSDDGSKVWLGNLNSTTPAYSFTSNGIVNNNGIKTSPTTVTSTNRTLSVGIYPIAIAYFDATSPEVMQLLWKTPSSGSSYIPIPNSAFSDGISATGPTSPSGLSAASGGYDRIILSWTDNSNNETGFEIWRSTNAGNGYLPVNIAAANTTSFTDSIALYPNTQYYYQIRAIGATGESSLIPGAGLVSATTANLPSIPGSPTGLVANPLSTTAIELSWNDNSTNETQFELWRSVGNNTDYRLLAFIDAGTGAQRTYTDNELFANTTYYYKVLAKGIGGSSNYSNEAFAVTGNNNPVLQNIPDFTMRYGTVYTLNITASDADGEYVTISATGVPSFGVFNSTGNGGGEIVFSPSSLQQGAYNVNAIATDAHGGQHILPFVLTVNSNYVPVITPVGNVNMNENAQLVVPLSATDQDGNASLVWSANTLPAFAVLTPGINGAANLTLSPNYAQAGVYPVSLSVSDGAGGVATIGFNITVNNIEISTNKWYVNMQYNELPGGPSPWNNVNTLTANNLRDQNNTVTAVDFQVVSNGLYAFNGGSVTGSNSGVYPDNVLRDYFYFGIFGASETIDLRFSSLDPGSTYNITLHAGSSWGGVPDNGTTVFTINGVSKSLYVQNNTQNTVTFTGISPTAAGIITITCSKAPGTPVGYINAVVLEQGFDDGTSPVLPENLAAQNMPDGSVKLTWTDIAYNEEAYQVYRSTTLNGSYTLLNPGAANHNTTEYVDNTVNGLTTYYYKLEAINSHGSSGLTNAVSITTTNKAPVVNTIGDVYMKSGTSANIAINSSDDAGETLTAVVTNLPSFATFTNNGNGDGSISINPGLADIGNYKDVTVTVTDNFGLSTVRKFNITVTDNQTRSFYINFAGESGSPEGKPWNNIVAYPYGGLAVGGLKDDLDVTTGYGITLVDGWTSSWYGGMITGNNSGLYPDNVIKNSIYEGSTATKRIQFTSLNPTKLYNIALFSSNNAGFDASFTASSQGQSVVFNGRFNSIRNVQLNGLVPNASGIIEVTITKATAANYMFLNGLILQEYDAGQLIRPIDMMTEINAPGIINMYWSDRSNNETGFEIWRAAGSGSFSLLTTTAANVNSYTDNTAATNIRYSYKVRAVNGPVSSEFSNTANRMLGNNRVLINLSTTSISQGSPWNNARAIPLEGVNFNNLSNTGGYNTGYSLKITSDFGGNFDLGMNTATGVIPANVMRSSWWVEGGGATGSIKLYNMNQAKLYRIGIMGSSSWTGDFTATYTINDRVVYLNAYLNDSKCVYIDDVRPNENGEINITLGTVTGARWGFWSAVTLETYDDDSRTSPIISSRMAMDLITEASSESAVPPVTSMPLPVTGTIQQGREIAPERLGNDVRVFPNPFNETVVVNITSEKEKTVTLRLLDMAGREVMRKPAGIVKGSVTVTLNAVDLAKTVPGVYILQVLSNGKQEKTFKLIKRK
jgi:hypothetical protein